MLRILTALGFLLFMGCGKDNDRPGLIGSWRAIATWNGNTAWGGCSCWQDLNSLSQHSLEFRMNGTYELMQAPISSASGCNGTYQRQGTNTIRWNYCGPDVREDKLVFETNFLIIEIQQPGGVYKVRYRRQ